MVFEVDASNCKRERDEWGEFEHVPGDVLKAKNCGCVKPIRMCKVPFEKALAFYKQARLALDYDPLEKVEDYPEFPTLKCKWLKV